MSKIQPFEGVTGRTLDDSILCLMTLTKGGLITAAHSWTCSFFNGRGFYYFGRSSQKNLYR
jgi:hypothetical protein